MEKYDIPEELEDIYDELQGLTALRKMLVKLPFNFNKCKKLGYEIALLQREFWSGVYDIYPELRDKEHVYYNMRYGLHEE